MACETHNWIFDSLPCPKCVAATVTEPEIPDFLARNPDGSFKIKGYPTDPAESAARRRAEYIADEEEEARREHAANLDGTAVHNLLGKRD